jgi:hypothetical protein
MASTKTLVLTYANESKTPSIISHDIESGASTLVEQASIRSYTQTIAYQDSLLVSMFASRFCCTYFGWAGE